MPGNPGAITGPALVAGTSGIGRCAGARWIAHLGMFLRMRCAKGTVRRAGRTGGQACRGPGKSSAGQLAKSLKCATELPLPQALCRPRADQHPAFHHVTDRARQVARGFALGDIAAGACR